MTEQLRTLPERDTTKPAEEQGVFRKFEVRRTDESDRPGGKHHGCEYFVLDVNHDPHAKAAMAAYAQSCAITHPELAKDLLKRYSLPSLADACGAVKILQAIKVQCAIHQREAESHAHSAFGQIHSLAELAIAALSLQPRRETIADYLANLLRDGKIDCISINCEQMAEQIAALPTAPKQEG